MSDIVLGPGAYKVIRDFIPQHEHPSAAVHETFAKFGFMVGDVLTYDEKTDEWAKQTGLYIGGWRFTPEEIEQNMERIDKDTHLKFL